MKKIKKLRMDKKRKIRLTMRYRLRTPLKTLMLTIRKRQTKLMSQQIQNFLVTRWVTKRLKKLLKSPSPRKTTVLWTQ